MNFLLTAFAFCVTTCFSILRVQAFNDPIVQTALQRILDNCNNAENLPEDYCNDLKNAIEDYESKNTLGKISSYKELVSLINSMVTNLIDAGQESVASLLRQSFGLDGENLAEVSANFLNRADNVEADVEEGQVVVSEEQASTCDKEKMCPEWQSTEAIGFINSIVDKATVPYFAKVARTKEIKRRSIWLAKSMVGLATPAVILEVLDLPP